MKLYFFKLATMTVPKNDRIKWLIDLKEQWHVIPINNSSSIRFTSSMTRGFTSGKVTLMSMNWWSLDYCLIWIHFLLGQLYYSIVPSSEMSGSVCMFVCMFVYMCTLPWPDHSRLRSETFIIWLKIYRRRKIMQIWYLPTQCDTIMPHFLNLPLLTFLPLISK